MSLKSISGSSLVEVMVMMVILSITLVGIYSMVDSGKKLAYLTDTRLNAVNIAREWLESVTTLRDTFALNGYESGTCGGTDAFFSTDGHILLDTNCPIIQNTTETPYTLDDSKSLEKKDPLWNPNYDVCINESGWYSQEFSNKNWYTLSECRNNPNNCVPCSTTTTYCETNTTQSCKTQFQRKITFTNDGCNGYNTKYCIHVYSKVWWGTDADNSLTLDQIITTID